MKAAYHQKQLTASVLMLTTSQPQKVLLIHHKKHGTWLQPGGHVEPEENPVECALREAREETGIDLSPWLKRGPKIDTYAYLLPLPDYTAEYLIPPHKDEPEHFHVDWLYMVLVPEELELALEARSSHEIGWFTLEQAMELPMFENTKHFLQEKMT
jgi:8-oxo-dGTP pyrophosphatase MutT (NUDIX family)